MRKEQLDLDNIFIIRDFYSPEACAAVIAESETAGYEDATLTTSVGFVMDKSVRDNARLIVDHAEHAADLWRVLAPFVPAKLDKCWSAVGLNERLRFYRYDVGQRFHPHFDGAFHRNSEEKSKLTFMIYLNDDFGGGETKFYLTNGQFRLMVKPERGMALLFAHQQLHEGAPVWEGRKYVLRSDVMYRLDDV